MNFTLQLIIHDFYAHWFLISLGLQDRCGAVFAHLAMASCVVELEDMKRERQYQSDKRPAIPSVLVPARPKLARLHAAHALCMDVLLSMGLEMGSHSNDCWQHVFRSDQVMYF